MAPQRANLVLASNVPHGKTNVFVLDCLHVEANGGDRRHDLAQLELVHCSSEKSAFGEGKGKRKHQQMVVLPAASRPTIRIRISFFPCLCSASHAGGQNGGLDKEETTYKHVKELAKQ